MQLIKQLIDTAEDPIIVVYKENTIGYAYVFQKIYKLNPISSNKNGLNKLLGPIDIPRIDISNENIRIAVKEDFEKFGLNDEDYKN